MSGRTRLVLLLAASVVAFAWPMQESGWNQKAHYALVRSLADGTARIDAFHRETGDKAYMDGHFYSVKPPGLALSSLPAYLVLEAFHAVPDDDRTAIWLLGLLTVVPFALVLCEITRQSAALLLGGDGSGPGSILATGTIVLPFATLYFSHVPTAALAACAVYLAIRARGAPRPGRAALSGLCAGLAIVMEYPSAIVAVAVLAYVAWTSAGRLRSALSWLVGAAVGACPIPIYNAWAFGSPTRSPYSSVVDPSDWQSDTPTVLANPGAGIAWPKLDVLADLLLSERGLLVTTPLVIAGLAGLLLLGQRGRRAEAWLLGGTFAVALVWNAGLTTFFYGGAFGGDSPGARYLIFVVPLAIVPIGLARRRARGPVIALWAISLAFMAVATATRPQVGPEETKAWWDGLVDGRFTETPLSHAGLGTGWVAILPFFVAVAVVAVVAAWDWCRSLDRADVIAAALTLVGWGVVALSSRELLASPGGTTGALLSFLVLAAAVASVVAVVRLTPTGIARGPG